MDSYYDMLNVQLSLVDEVEDWIASPEPPDSGQELHLLGAYLQQVETDDFRLKSITLPE